MRHLRNHLLSPRRRALRVLALVLAALLCACSVPFAAAQGNRADTAESSGTAPASQPEIVEVRVGIAGKYKLGHWTPVRVAVAAGEQPFSGEVVLTAPDGDGIPARFVRKLDVPAGARTDSWHYVQFGRYASGLTVELNRDSQTVARARLTPNQMPEALSSTQRWYVTLGRSIGIEQVAASARDSGTREAAASGVVESAADIPDRWIGYAGVDAVAMSTSEPGVLEELTPDQFAALELWVRMGGKLILSCGRRGDEVLAEGSRIQSLVPGKLAEVIPLARTAGLENYAGSTQRLDMVLAREGDRSGDRGATPRDDDTPDPLLATRLYNVRGIVEAYEGSGPADVPTIVRAPLGLGQVAFVAVDLDAPPLADWQGRPRLVSKVLRESTHRGADEDANDHLGTVMQLGFSDIVGQLRHALERFPQVKQVPFVAVAALVLVYLAAIGPLDYLLVRKLLRGRMHWTWVTFPLLVVLFGAVAVLVVIDSRGSHMLVNQVEIIDFDLTDDAPQDLGGRGGADPGSRAALARLTVWANLYSPHTANYDLSLDHSLLRRAESPHDLLLAWQGFPSDALGGMYSRTGAAVPESTYTVHTDGREARLTGLPIQVASTKALLARGWVETSLPEPGELRVGRQNDLLEGELVNPLPVELTNCVLYFRNWAYLIEGTLAPGQRIRFDRFRQPRTRSWQLTQSRVVESKDVSTPWDPTDGDVPRIVEMMMFHDAAGGRTYTNLSHRCQPFVDLSDQIYLGRAVLVGRARSREAVLARDGEPLDESYEGHWTFYRVVLSVGQSES